MYYEQREAVKFKFDIETINNQLSEKQYVIDNCGFSWGNESDEISLFVSISRTNCGRAIKELEKTMGIYPNFTYRLIFLFKDVSQPIVQHFITLYKTMTKKEFFMMLETWYDMKKKSLDSLREKYPAPLSELNEPMWNHLDEFNQTTTITYTPAIMVNGKLLSRSYSYQDLFNIVRSMNNEKS